MNVNGIIEDSTTGQPIKGATVNLIDPNNRVLLTIISDNDGYFGIYDQAGDIKPGSGLSIFVSAKEYNSLKINPPLSDDTYIYELEPIQAGSIKKKVDWGLIIGVSGLALGLLSMGKKKKVSGMNPATQTILLYAGGGALLYFGVISPILKKLGILKSQETQDLDNATQDPNSFWSADWWKHISNATILTVGAADNIIDTIAGAFKWYNDDENVVIGQFKQLTHKAQVSFLAYRFLQRYNADFLSWLRGGDEWYADNLSDSEVATINDYLKKLPN